MNWGWSISAAFYEFAYSKLMHGIDGYTIGFLASEQKLSGARVLDAGAGTGTIDFKLIEAGAREVIAIENNPAMLWRLYAKRRKKQKYMDRLRIINDDMYDDIFSSIPHSAFDVQLFRRCLYGPEEQVRQLLSQGYQHLADGGMIFIVHPEAEPKKYFDNGFGGIALSHVLKWCISNIGRRTSIEYQRYTQQELATICRESCPGASIECYSPIRPAYNILTITKE